MKEKSILVIPAFAILLSIGVILLGTESGQKGLIDAYRVPQGQHSEVSGGADFEGNQELTYIPKENLVSNLFDKSLEEEWKRKYIEETKKETREKIKKLREERISTWK